MKKYLCLILALVMICLTFTGCKSYEKEKELYARFLAGEIAALNEEFDEMPLVDYLPDYEKKEEYIYTYCDVSGDKTPELCVRQQNETIFFTVKENQLYYLYAEMQEEPSFDDDQIVWYDAQGNVK